MFSFFKKWVYTKRLNSAKLEINDFVNSLKGMDQTEIARLVAIATILKNNLKNIDIDIHKALEEISIFNAYKVENKLLELIYKLQSELNGAAAAGLMVWLHSVRAKIHPQIRFLGKEMWFLLSKGFETASSEISDVEKICGVKCNSPQCLNFKYIPSHFKNESKYDKLFAKYKTLREDILSDGAKNDIRISVLALAEIFSGYSPEEAVIRSYIYDLALQVKEVGSDAFRLMDIFMSIELPLTIFKEWKDLGKIRNDLWEKETTIILKITKIDKEQLQWVEGALDELNKINPTKEKYKP